ncbi:MAG: YfcC family protein [Tenuifilaceae bacterium]
MKIKSFPHTITIIMFIMIVFIVLTWVIQAGEYERKEFNGRMIVVSGTFKEIDNQPQGLLAMLTAPLKGFVSASQIIGFCLLVGGAFGMVNKTGAISAGLSSILNLSVRKPKYKKLVIPLIMIFFSLAGATFGMSESTIVFIMITIPLAIAMGYDSIVGICMSFMAAGVGFAAAITNPFNVGVAQGIAEVPMFSGWEFRIFVWFVMTSIAIAYVMYYARRLEKDITISPVYELDRKRNLQDMQKVEQMEFNWKRKIILVFLFLALAMLVVGANKWKWYITEISALFLALGIVSAIIYRLSMKDTIDSFISGAKDMIMAGLVIGLSRGLLVIATDGKIIDSILFAVSNWGKDLSSIVSIQIIFLFQSCFTFFVPSGSGQAALTVPIVAPLSDLLGIARQTAIMAFQLGDGIMSMIVPTSGVTMGVLAIANIPYQTWVKWFVKLLLIFFITAMVLLVLALYYFRTV